MVEITVFYKDGLKRGPPANNAGFAKITEIRKEPGIRWISHVDLRIINQMGNRYRVETLSAPLSPEPLTIRVQVPDISPNINGDMQEIGMNDGDSTEVWLRGVRH